MKSLTKVAFKAICVYSLVKFKRHSPKICFLCLGQLPALSINCLLTLICLWGYQSQCHLLQMPLRISESVSPPPSDLSLPFHMTLSLLLSHHLSWDTKIDTFFFFFCLFFLLYCNIFEVRYFCLTHYLGKKNIFLK